MLPTILYVPGWDAKTNKDGGLPIPKRAGPYAAYITALIKRYGPHGSFWAGKSHRLPIRAWQIWNEANLIYYWPQPFAKGYVSLLRAAHKAIKHADPEAKVVLGALTNTAWRSLGQINHIRGARRAVRRDLGQRLHLHAKPCHHLPAARAPGGECPGGEDRRRCWPPS